MTFSLIFKKQNLVIILLAAFPWFVKAQYIYTDLSSEVCYNGGGTSRSFNVGPGTASVSVTVRNVKKADAEVLVLLNGSSLYSFYAPQGTNTYNINTGNLNLGSGGLLTIRLREDSSDEDACFRNLVIRIYSAIAPTNGNPTNVTPYSFRANWSSAPGSVNHYKLYVSRNDQFLNYEAGYNGKVVSGTNYTLDNLRQDRTYYYRVSTVNGYGESAPSNSKSATTLRMPPPTAYPATNVSNTGFTASWSQVSGSGTTYSVTVPSVGTYSTSSTSRNITGLVAGKDYTYYVRAEDQHGDDTNSSNIISFRTTISAPSTYAATNVQEDEFAALWSAEPGVSQYLLYISTDPLFSSHIAGYNGKVVDGNAINVENIPSNTTYYYRVRSLGPDETSDYSSSYTAVTTLPRNRSPIGLSHYQTPTCVPALGSTEVSYNVGPGEVEVIAKVSANNKGDAIFNVSLDSQDLYTSVVGRNETKTINKLLNLGSGGELSILYREDSSEGGASVCIEDLEIKIYGTIVPDIAPPTSITHNSFVANWSDTPGAASYKLYVARENTEFLNHEAGYDGKVVTGTSHTVTGMRQDRTYMYRVSAVNAYGDESPVSEHTTVSTTTLPSPMALAAIDVTNTGFTARWEHYPGAHRLTLVVPEVGSFDVAGSTSKVVTGLLPGRTYSYYLFGEDIAGDEIPNSNTITVYLSNNHIKEKSPRIAISSESQLTSLNRNELLENVSYYDGLGREKLHVQVEAGPNHEDLVQYVKYDDKGRQNMEYLPYAKSYTFPGQFPLDPRTDLNAFYATSGNDVVTDSRYFSEHVFEASPLDRVLETYGPGTDWYANQKKSTQDYLVNGNNEVIRWEHNNILTQSNQYYPANSLYKNEITDEDGHKAITFTDVMGRTILKRNQIDNNNWADTYYLYDDKNNLVYVIPPAAIEEHLASNFFDDNSTQRQSFLNRWTFSYKYDDHNRMIEKKVPGVEPVYLVYDHWDRLVLTQYGNMRVGDNRWLFTAYDAFNRPVMTGYVSNGQNRETVQAHVSTLTNPADRYTEYTGAGTHGYGNSTYPLNGRMPGSTLGELLTVTYYDNHSHQALPDWSVLGLGFSDPESILSQNATVKTLVTGSMTKTDDGNWIRSVNYYDDKYRLIQSQSINHLGGKDVVTNYYDFIGQLDKSIVSHSDGANNTTLTKTFKYDHVGRLLESWHQLNQETPVLIAQHRYNGIGELIEKNLHSKDQTQPVEGDFAQSLDYSYNIRGWLTNVNDSDLSASMDGDLFGMNLVYNTSDVSLGNTQLYNGNISAMKWSDQTAPGTSNSRAYSYAYDKLNRLKSANHFENNVASSKYSVSGLDYDFNGNIKQLQRKGESGTSFIDDLNYGYVGNQLQYVHDLATDTLGFNDRNNTTDDYDYDPNGNMIKDLNKAISNIDYNHLNLPIRVDFQNGDYLTYNYDAGGIKLQQKVYEGGALSKTTDYVGEFIYEDLHDGNGRQLLLIQHEEGRVVPKTNKTPSILWTFDQDAEGFYATGSQVADFQHAAPGHIEGTITGNNPMVRSPDNLNFQATDYDVIRIRLENNTSNTVSQIFFTTVADPTGSAEKSIDFPISANSGYQEYSVNMAALPTWIGTIKWLRFDPTQGAGTGTFKIDEIELIGNSSQEGHDYQYHLQDHLGNTRLTFSTTPENYTMVEDYEDETSDFADLKRLNRLNANSTVGGTYISFLAEGQTSSLVFVGMDKGDTVNLSVQANYETAPTANTFLPTAYNALFSSFDGAFGGVEGIDATANEFNNALSGANMVGKGDVNTAPRAFLNFIFFDKDMNYATAGFKQISTAALGVSVHELVQLDAPFVADREGYLLAYLSNENQEAVMVHFDDFTVYHGKTNVVQSDDYYPFGLTFNEFKRTASTANRFNTFQDQERNEETGWIQFKWRNHQLGIGRFFNIDPLAESFYYNSPYAFSENRIISDFEMEGLERYSMHWVNEAYIQNHLEGEELKEHNERMVAMSKTQMLVSISMMPGVPKQLLKQAGFLSILNVGVDVASSVSTGKEISLISIGNSVGEAFSQVDFADAVISSSVKNALAQDILSAMVDFTSKSEFETAFNGKSEVDIIFDFLANRANNKAEKIIGNGKYAPVLKKAIELVTGHSLDSAKRLATSGGSSTNPNGMNQQDATRHSGVNSRALYWKTEIKNGKIQPPEMVEMKD